MNKLFQEAVKV